MNTYSAIMFVLAAILIVLVGLAQRPLDRGAAAVTALVMVALGIAGEVLR